MASAPPAYCCFAPSASRTMRMPRPATMPLLADAAGPVDVGQHGQTLLEGRILGDADLRAEVVGSAVDARLGTLVSIK